MRSQTKAAFRALCPVDEAHTSLNVKHIPFIVCVLAGEDYFLQTSLRRSAPHGPVCMCLMRSGVVFGTGFIFEARVKPSVNVDCSRQEGVLSIMNCLYHVTDSHIEFSLVHGAESPPSCCIQRTSSRHLICVDIEFRELDDRTSGHPRPMIRPHEF
jgi:hypothetical protein